MHAADTGPIGAFRAAAIIRDNALNQTTDPKPILETSMKQSALKMILGMMAIAVLISTISGSPLPLLIIALASYSAWHVAKGLDG